MMSGRGRVFEFDRAIVRRPDRSVVRALRAVDRGAPDFSRLCTEHDDYVTALRRAGVEVTVLAALEDYPDALFVEDPALVFSAGAILLRARAPTRAGEAGQLAPVLDEHFDTVLELGPPGFVDGGDVLVTPELVMIGLSGRTDQAGAEALVECLKAFGLTGRIVATPEEVLHFKSDCALIDSDTVLATRRLAASGVFDNLRVLETPPGEEAAANALRVNDVVLVGSRFTRTAELLDAHGYQLVPLDVTEIGKIDAGLSCMSLRWSRA